MPFATLKLKIASLPEPLRIGIGLGLGFALTLLLLVVLMVTGFGYMAKIHAEVEEIIQVSNVKIDFAHTMKYAQRDRAVRLYSMALMTDAFDKDEELQQFDRRAFEFTRAWRQFQDMAMDAQERVLAERINSLIQQQSLLAQKAIDKAVSGHGVAVADYIRKDVIPGQQAVADAIDKLLILQQDRLRQATLNVADSYQKARSLLYWLSSVTIVLSILIATLVMRQVMRQSRELEHKALFDDLTGLPNRSLFFDRLGQAALMYENDKKPFSIVVIDLDRFKEVNDREGHHVGDLLLRHVANKISESMRRTDTVARMGGDEFVLLLPAATAASAENIVKKLYLSLCQRISLDGATVNIAVSMGIAAYPEHDQDVRHLLLKADIAMYAAKRANAGYRIYTPEIEVVAARNLELQNELRHAIGSDQMILHYQPKISHHSGCIMGVEALVHWDHPQRGLIPADDFIPLAESSGLIQPLAFWVLKTALQQCVHWHDAGHTFTVSFNLSARNLLDGDLYGRISGLLETYKVKPEWLVFEITESAMMVEPVRALETLTKLHKMGIQLSLDDFGTGYSSLAYLKKLPVGEIKIDKSFIRDLELDASDTVIVRSTIALGHNLGMKVVAEGVENIEIWELLTALGCDASQGYLMSRPLSAKALDDWLATSAWAQPKESVSGIYAGMERRKNDRNPDSV